MVAMASVSQEWELGELLADMRSQLEETQRRAAAFDESLFGFTCKNDQDTPSKVLNFESPTKVHQYKSTPVSEPPQTVAPSKPRREVHPDKFNGASWDNFILHFEACKELNGWVDKEACSWLAASLTGDAVQVLSGGGIGLGYNGLKAKLERRYGICNSPENYVLEFRNRKRKPGESLQELAQSLRHLVVKAYPDMAVDSQELLATEQFKDALEDTEIRAAIFRQKPKNMEDTVSTAIEAECFIKAEKARAKGKSHLRLVEAQPAQPKLKELETQMQQLKELMKDLQMAIVKTQETPKKKRDPKLCYYCIK